MSDLTPNTMPYEQQLALLKYRSSSRVQFGFLAAAQETYQVTGKAHEVAIDEELVIPDEDIEMVANQANVSEDEAKAALEDTNGDLAEAILKLNQ